MTDLAGLIERLEKATGPDRELDAALWYALIEKPRPGDKRDQDMIGRWPAYTASLDAALALLERASPGAMWQVGFDPDDGSMLARIVTAAPECRYRKANHDTPALALVLALLRTLDPQHD